MRRSELKQFGDRTRSSFDVARGEPLACAEPPSPECAKQWEDAPSAKRWSKHDAAFRVGVGTGVDDRKDALTVFKDGRVCTADGMVSRCGEEDGMEALHRREREAALPGEVDELQKKMAGLEGKDTDAAGNHSVASGEGSAAEGGLSSAMGYYTTAQSYAEVVLGRYKCARPVLAAPPESRERGLANLRSRPALWRGQ